MVKVKICGIRDLATALAAVEAGADALGFVFARSKRKISYEEARELISKLPKGVAKVGVFVDKSIAFTQEIGKYCSLDYIQLHNKIDPLDLTYCRIPIIKAFSIRNEEDVIGMEKYKASFYLVDSYGGDYIGGNGKSFKWELLDSLKPAIKRKLILAGGLDLNNISQAIERVKPLWVDVSSSVETDGKKDVLKIKEFIKKAKNIL
ncbi:MAG TPA: phosphoribosylanthranilate isomerase [Clostridiaceae bacterium]